MGIKILEMPVLFVQSWKSRFLREWNWITLFSSVLMHGGTLGHPARMGTWQGGGENSIDVVGDGPPQMTLTMPPVPAVVSVVLCFWLFLATLLTLTETVLHCFLPLCTSMKWIAVASVVGIQPMLSISLKLGQTLHAFISIYCFVYFAGGILIE